MDQADVQAALTSGDAVALLPDDTRSPFRYRDHWYAIPNASQDELWQPVAEERGAQLDLMLYRLNLVGSPGSESA